MDPVFSYGVIGAVTLLASVLTFFSGFGLGTLLLPAFSLFFPIEVAIAATAVVHLVNTLAKGALMIPHAHWRTVFQFAVPAALMAWVGAMCLGQLGQWDPWFSYALGERICEVRPVPVMVATVVFAFALMELLPSFQSWSFPEGYVPLGGALSGFFGGLSGHQGALRTAFLGRLGLGKEAFVGTTALAAIGVDGVRLLTYGNTSLLDHPVLWSDPTAMGLLGTGCAMALLGSFLGKRYLPKLSMASLQQGVGVLLMVYAVALGVGLI